MSRPTISTYVNNKLSSPQIMPFENCGDDSNHKFSNSLESSFNDKLNLDFKIGYLNIQGLERKNIIVNDYANENLFDVLCLSEHWCKKDEISYKILDDFTLINSFCRDFHIHGGVSIYVKNSIMENCCSLSLDNYCKEIHFEASGIVVENLKLIIIVIYRSPSGNPQTFLDNIDNLLTSFSVPKWQKFSIIIGGDFNSSFDVTRTEQSVIEIKNLLQQFNLVFINSSPTRGLACLDNIFTNIDKALLFSEVVGFPFSDHDCVSLKLIRPKVAVDYSTPSSKVIFTRPIDSTKISNFRYAVSNFSWDLLLFKFQNCPADVIFDKFLAVFIDLFNMNIPKRKCRVNNNGVFKKKVSNEWYTPQLASMKNKVLLYLDAYKLHKSDHNRLSYCKAKREYKQAINEAKKLSNIHAIESSTNKCRKAWNIMNTVAKGNKSRSGINISADEFNNFCVESIEKINSAVDKSTHNIVDLMKNVRIEIPQSNFVFKEVTTFEILSIVKNFKASNSVDYYDISCNLLKKIIDCIVDPLTICINKCLLECKFPETLKISKVVPVYKKGEKECPASYRPISITPVLSKIFETIIYKQVSFYFDSLNIISNKQFGFRKGKSTTDAIECLVKMVFKVFEDKRVLLRLRSVT